MCFQKTQIWCYHLACGAKPEHPKPYTLGPSRLPGLPRGAFPLHHLSGASALPGISFQLVGEPQVHKVMIQHLKSSLNTKLFVSKLAKQPRVPSLERKLLQAGRLWSCATSLHFPNPVFWWKRMVLPKINSWAGRPTDPHASHKPRPHQRVSKAFKLLQPKDLSWICQKAISCIASIGLI